MSMDGQSRQGKWQRTRMQQIKGLMFYSTETTLTRHYGCDDFSSLRLGTWGGHTALVPLLANWSIEPALLELIFLKTLDNVKKMICLLGHML